MTRFSGRPNRSPSGARAAGALVTALMLAVIGLVVSVATPAMAAGGITLDKTSTGTVLLGGTANFTLAAGNAADQPEQYNLSYRDVLPVGVSYVGGSTSPANFGEPQVLVGADTFDQQTLVWSNVSDLTPGSTVALNFDAKVDATLYPIGSKVTNTGSAFSSSDPQEVPDFDTDGGFLPGKETVSATDSATTIATAIRITKGSGAAGDGTPENELLRGVNDHQTVYSLTVTNNGVDTTKELLVTDFVPAGMEFLGCGGAFNSTTPEYPGARNTVDKVDNCLQPGSVETVEDPAGYPPGAYTKVVWTLGPLAAGEGFVVRYAAGIPQRSNTMVFTGDPPARDGAQAANLDNNTGAPTVETASELALKNYAEVAGNFQGADVADTTNHTVTAEDLRIVKSVTPKDFDQGALATYTMVIDTSEYADATDLIITDELPAGLCPLRTSDADYTPPVAECAIDQGAAPTNASITGVRTNPDGSFTLTIIPDKTSLDANGNLVITYQALMHYDPPTSANDSFTNTVRIEGTTTAPAKVEAPTKEPQKVSDESSATIYSGGATQIHSADVQVTKTSGDAVAGANLVYTLIVKNNGPDTAGGPFPVVDTLPGGIGALSWTGTGWNCSLGAGTVSCTRTNPANTLAPGASFAAITITVAVPPGATSGTVLTNTATVGSSTYDPNLVNNSDRVSDTVARSVDLGVVKTTSGTITAGQGATYTLDVTNHGPSDSTGPVSVTDTLPAGTTFVSAAGTDWDCSAAGLALTCTRTAGLDNGRAAPQITVVVHVPAGRTSDLTNFAAVDGPEPDPNPANDTSQVTDPVQTSADLALTKVHEGTFVPGSNGTYRLSVTNHGPSDAASPVRITDQLASELSFVSDNSDSWACSADAGNLLTCTLSGDLPAGDTREFTITVTIASAQTGDIANQATVGSPTSDPHLANNTDTHNTGVSVRADLGITKSHTGNATAGQDLAFALDVANHGESDSPGPITVSDTIPAGMSYLSATGIGWDCSASGQVVTCTRTAGLATGASTVIILRVAVAADAGPAELTNWASVSGTAPDPNPDNDTDSDVVTVLDRANVSITKTANPTTVVAGDLVQFTLTVTNDGPSDADNVQVADALPPGLEYVTVDAQHPFACADANPVDCQLDTMPAGSHYTIVVTARVGSAVADGAKIVNRAAVSTSTPGGDPDDNNAQATIDVTTRADLRIIGTHPAGAVLAGEQVRFDLAVQNDGPSDAQADVVVTDTLPDGMSYVTNTGPWTCTPTGQDVTCVLDDAASVPAGTDAPALTITARVAADLDPDGLVDGMLTNTAAVTSDTTDPNPDNNSDSDTVVIGFNADLSITKTHTPPARVGDPLTFTLAVANAGPSTARLVTVADNLPAGLEFVSATGPGWTCTNTGQQVDCSLVDPLPAATTALDITVTVTVLASAYPGVTNTTIVDSATTDPVSANNNADDNVTVPPQVDLGITKRHTPEPLQVGDQATYTLGVSNAGATDDPGPITVTDTLPAGLTFVSGSGNGWNCTATSQQITCTRSGGLETTGNTSITLVVTVGPEAYPAVTNTATVTSPAEDTNPGNNNASDPATVLPLYDLALAKELASITGSRADWTLTVTNNGPNLAAAGSVVVVDELPDELTYLGFTGDGWTCAPKGQLVVCSSNADLAAGENASLVLQTGIDPGATGTIVNSASIVGGVTDTAEGRVPSDSGGLASTGGIATGVGALGLLSLLAGAVLLAYRKRRT